jgi:hypothetical protein
MDLANTTLYGEKLADYIKGNIVLSSIYLIYHKQKIKGDASGISGGVPSVGFSFRDD